jgi:hypothetical protein
MGAHLRIGVRLVRKICVREYVRGMKTLRTPDENFADPAEFPYVPTYSEIDDGEGGPLRVAAEHPERFARIVFANTGLPTGDLPMPEIWWRFREAIQGQPRYFLQEDAGEELAEAIVRFLRAVP